MSKPTTIKDAIANWEQKHNEVAAKAVDIGLQFQWPPIEKMDSNLSVLAECRKLSLSTNMIDKIVGISSLKNLKILVLSRNYLKTINGIEVLAETLEQLWVSYNLIEKLKPIEAMKNLKVFYLSNNNVKEWGELVRLNLATKLEEITFAGNPLQEYFEDAVFRSETMRRLPHLKKLDGDPLIR
ncbi:dynein light chain 1, axonemal [Teleopsis dalmanni]|uniref:dynein light chain 1, axonemal n=1 Tax=Teleopsis dalmanni TaxID=139649 RepID=UPI0018CDE34D|nr:dynein light chain 1, axonemal [Teleopsis dalmanni]